MSIATTELRTRGDAKPLPPELLDKVRAALAGDTSRKALGSFGVSHTTLVAALAGLPIGKGSRALIREALKERANERVT